MRTKRTVAIGALLLICIIALCVVFLKNAEVIRNGISLSLQEDFKIKESLGQVFFLEGEEKSKPVSSGITVTSLSMPCEGEITLNEVFGEKVIVIDSIKYQSIFATADGIIESCEGDKITLRHDDGKLSCYYGVGSLCAVGDSVFEGESIGYAKGEIVFRLYENCVALDPLEYLS